MDNASIHNERDLINMLATNNIHAHYVTTLLPTEERLSCRIIPNINRRCLSDNWRYDDKHATKWGVEWVHGGNRTPARNMRQQANGKPPCERK